MQKYIQSQISTLELLFKDRIDLNKGSFIRKLEREVGI